MGGAALGKLATSRQGRTDLPCLTVRRPLLSRPSRARNESWNIPLILPIGISEAAKEFPLLEDQHQVSRGDDGYEEDVHAQVIDDEGVSYHSDACAQIPGMTHHSINPLPQQSALSLL